MGVISHDEADVFWSRIARTAEPDDCWTWTGSCNPRTGHGYLTINSRQQFAHRVAYELLHGPIPPGMVILHTCDHPSCCNPAHLALGTRADQMRRRSRATASVS